MFRLLVFLGVTAFFLLLPVFLLPLVAGVIARVVRTPLVPMLLMLGVLLFILFFLVRFGRRHCESPCSFDAEFEHIFIAQTVRQP
jgi:hypothetical protein